MMFTANISFSQQEVQVSHNMFNHLDINPGFAGLNDAICGTLIARDQWIGFKDPDGNNVNPRTYLLSVDTPIRFWRGGAGLTIIQDQLGFEKNLDVKLSFSHHIFIGNGQLGMGLQAEFQNKQIDFSKFKPLEPGDMLLANGTSKEGNIVPDFTLGFFYINPQRFYSGISLSQFLRMPYHFPDVQATPTLTPHGYIDAGMYLHLTNRLELMPSLLMKTDFVSMQVDINSLLKMDNMYWCGLSWRQSDAIAVIVGGNVFRGLEASYAYDFTTSALGANGRSLGSHEIMLHYCYKIPPKVIGTHVNVRFLSPSIEK